MTPVELIGKFTKPIALVDPIVREHDRGSRRHPRADFDRLHVRSVGVAPFPVVAATGIMMLELFVAFLQAFVFCCW